MGVTKYTFSFFPLRAVYSDVMDNNTWSVICLKDLKHFDEFYKLLSVFHFLSISKKLKNTEKASDML